ncbi:MAG: hypothetical protein WC438_03500 [Candidatus Pacearchaeota archaeon]
MNKMVATLKERLTGKRVVLDEPINAENLADNLYAYWQASNEKDNKKSIVKYLGKFYRVPWGDPEEIPVTIRGHFDKLYCNKEALTDYYCKGDLFKASQFVNHEYPVWKCDEFKRKDSAFVAHEKVVVNARTKQEKHYITLGIQDAEERDGKLEGYGDWYHISKIKYTVQR